jgi:hypothetical protein
MTDAPEFDWQEAQDQGAVVQQSVEQVAVYTNLHDDVVVRQQQMWDEERDTYIVIARGNLPAFIAKLQELAGLGIPTTESPKAEPLSGAERSRRYRQNKRRRDENVTKRDDEPRDARDGELRLVAAE